MNGEYQYQIVDQDGYSLIEIYSNYTSLSIDEYFKRYIVPMLPTIERTFLVEKALWLEHHDSSSSFQAVKY
jgi:hypothetical protein|tara:strand:- start:383 stop:595 length:213 start_codon:yes stop_codon:yes gene_type:complete